MSMYVYTYMPYTTLQNSETDQEEYKFVFSFKIMCKELSASGILTLSVCIYDSKFNLDGNLELIF